MNALNVRRGAWMLTFADLLSILLCFLVLAYALKAAPDGARERALSAIREVFRPGDAGQSGMAALPQAARGGNYWATWLKARAAGVPSLAAQPVAAHGATASLALSDGATVLTEGDIAALAGILNGSGASVSIRAGAVSDTASSWADAGRQAQGLAERLRAAGLRQEPRIAVSGSGPLLAVEIGREES